MTAFTQGQTIRHTLTISDPATGDPVDPDAGSLTFVTLDPTRSQAPALTYGLDAALVRDGPGLYHVDLAAAAPAGLWRRRWAWAVGGESGASEGAWDVPLSPFT